MLEDGRVKEERRKPERMERRDFGKWNRRWRSDDLDGRASLLAFAGRNQSHRAFMGGLTSVGVETLMQLGRDREADGEEEGENQTPGDNGAETLTTTHAVGRIGLA